MDFKSMKRKELQALCKEHGLPANSTNSQMIESLSSIFQENIKPKGCLKGSGGSSAEDLGILRGGTKKVTFVIQDEEEDESEEFTVKPVGNSKRKSVGRKSSVAPEVEKRSEKTEKNSRRKDATEVPRRTSRSSGLAGAVLWSPVVEKRKKKSGDGTEGVRKNTESTSSKEKDIFVEVPVTRSLRNRAVVGGGDEVLVTDQNPRTQKRKNSDKKEENEKAAAVLLEDETIGRKNLRKRYREGDSVEDEPPCRRSSRAKLEETVATEEIDVGRSKKQRRGGTETSLIEKVVANDIERISKPGGTAKRSRGNVLDCNAVGSGDVNDATGQKKAQSQGNNRASKQDDSTDSMSDVEDVTGATRRSTRSSSALSEVGKSVSAVGKSDQEGEAVRKSKSRKQVKDRGPRGAEPASLLPDSEVVVEPIKRSPRASSTLLEDGTSVTVVGKSVGGEVVRKGKSLKQAKDHNLKGGSTVSMLDSEVVAEPVRRSTRSSSTLLLDQTSLPLAGKSVKGGEVVRKGKSQKQVQDGPKVCLTALSPDTEVVAEPLRRSTRSSSTLPEDVTSLHVVGKLVKGGKVDRKGKSEKQVKDDGSNGGGSITSLPDCEVVADPPRRSTRSSSNLLEDVTSLPVVGKSVKGGEAVWKGKSQRQAKDHASTGGGSTASLPESEVIVEPVRRSKRNSSSLLENVTSLPVLGKSVKESEGVRKDKSQKQANDHAWGGGVSTASLSDNEVVAESTKRLTHSSSKLLEDESHLSAIGKSGGDDVAIRNYKRGKQQKDCASKQGDSTASLLDTETVTTPTRILTRSSKFFGNETVSPVVGKLGDTVSQENSWKQERDHTSGRPLLDDRAVTTPTRRSTCSSSKLLEGETLLKAETLGNDNEVRKDKSGKPSKNCALKLGCSSVPVPHNAAVMTPARRSTRSSSKLLEDGISLEFGKIFDENEAIRKDKLGKMSKNSASRKKSKNSAIKQGEIVGGCGSGGAMEVGSTSSQRKSSRKAPADSGVMQRQCSPDPASSLLEDIQNDSCVKGKSSGKKLSYVKQSSHVLEKEVDIRRTSIGCHAPQEQDILSDNKVPASKSTPAIDAAEEISVRVPPTAALSFSLSIAVDSGSEETEISNDVDNKIISEMKQSPANVQFQKIENSTSLVGVPKDLDDVCLRSNIKQSSFMEIAIKGKGELPLNNITEGFSEVQENVLRKVDTAVEAEGTLGSYGDDSSTAPSPVDPTSTINANSGETSVGALDDEDGLTGMESQNFTSQPVSLLSSEEQSTIFHTEISAMAHLKERDSAEEADVVHEDIMTGYGARQITTSRFSPSSEEQYLASDTEASPGLTREESNVEVEICGPTEDGVADNVATDISGPTSVCKRSEELSPTLNTDSFPEVDLEEPESEDKLDGSSEDVVAGHGATKIIDPVTSGSEVFPEASCNTNVGKSDSEVEEVHVANMGLIEGIEATKTAVSPFSCKSAEVLSPNLLPTLLNEISSSIDLREPDLKVETHAMKMASRSNDFLGEASDNSSYGARQITTSRFSPSSEEQYLASDTEASPGLTREESNVEVEICGPTEDGVADNVATDISGPTSVCKRSEELSPTLNTDSFPEVDLEEPESEDKLDGSSEDVVAGHEATKIIDPVTSGSEVFPEASCNTNVGKSDSEVEEVHVANMGLIEGIKATKTAVSPFSCKSAEVLSPNLLPTLLNEISPNIDLREPDLKVETHAMKMASRSNDFLGEASDNSSKTLEALATARRDAGDSCNIQRNFDNEIESCKADPDNILNAELVSGVCDARKIIEASAGDSDSQLKVIKETWVSSALSVTVNDGIATQDGTNDVEKNEDEVRPSSPSDNTAFDAIYIPTCGLTETPTMLGCEDSTKQVGIQDFPHVPDSEDARHLSDQQEGVLNLTESLVASDRSPKSAPKEQEALEQLNGVADSLPETVNTVNELTDVEFEKGVELGAVDAEEMENIKSLESVASIEGDSNTVTKKADIIVLDKFDYSDEVGQTQDEAFFLQEVKGSSGDLHTDDAASHPSLENSASMPGEVRFPSLEIFSLSTYMENAPSLPKMDAILSVAEQLNEDNTEKASEEEEILNNEEFPSPVSFSPLVNQEESQDSATLEKNTFSGGSLGFTAPPGTYLADSHKVGGQSNDEKEVGAKMDLRLPCNVHEELDNQKSPFAALTQSCKEERTQVSSIKSESVPEAREKHTELSASKSTYPADTLRCEDYNTRTVSSIKSESVPEARETHTEMSASKSTYPADTLRCEDYDTRTVYVTVLSEPRSEDADNTNNDNDLLEKNSEAEHGVDHGIKMSVFGMAQDSVVTGISENTEASSVGDQPLVKECLAKVVVDSSTKSQTPGEESNKYQGTLECFEQGSNVEKAWVDPGVTQMFVEALFHMDSEVASFVNDDAQVGRVGHHEENLAHGKCENFLEINTAETLATEEPEMKAVAVSGNSPTAGNFSGSSAEPCAGVDSQATRSTEQSDGQEGRRIFIQETSEVSQFTKDELFTVLDGIKIEGSATVVSKSETIEITPIPKVAKQEELIAKNCTELFGSNAAHQVLCDWKERSGIERKPTGNELGESKFRGTSTAQHALFSLDSGAVRGSSTTVREESISKDERMAPEEYFGDFGWAFGEDVDFGSSYHEVQHVDSQLPTESALGNSADHSSKSVIDVNEEQNKTSELDQTEDSKECVQSTPLQLDINVKPCSVIDDATRNKENTVGLKMDSALRHSEKPRISNSSRQPLQSVRRTKNEH